MLQHCRSCRDRDVFPFDLLVFFQCFGSCVVSLARWCFVDTHIVDFVCFCCNGLLSVVLMVNCVIVVGVVYIAKLIA